MIAFKPIYILTAMYVEMYRNNKYFIDILDSVVSKKVLLLVYKDLLKDEWIKNIESLPEETKKELVTECRSTGLKFNNERLIDAAKILHTIKFINENS